MLFLFSSIKESVFAYVRQIFRGLEISFSQDRQLSIECLIIAPSVTFHCDMIWLSDLRDGFQSKQFNASKVWALYLPKNNLWRISNSVQD